MNVPRMLLTRIFVNGEPDDSLGIFVNYSLSRGDSFIRSRDISRYIPLHDSTDIYTFELFFLDDGTTAIVDLEDLTSLQNYLPVISVDKLYVIPERFARFWRTYIDIDFSDREYLIKFIIFINKATQGVEWSYKLLGTHLMISIEDITVCLLTKHIDGIERELLKLSLV